VVSSSVFSFSLSFSLSSSSESERCCCSELLLLRLFPLLLLLLCFEFLADGFFKVDLDSDLDFEARDFFGFFDEFDLVDFVFVFVLPEEAELFFLFLCCVFLSSSFPFPFPFFAVEPETICVQQTNHTCNINKLQYMRGFGGEVFIYPIFHGSRPLTNRLRDRRQ